VQRNALEETIDKIKTLSLDWGEPLLSSLFGEDLARHYLQKFGTSGDYDTIVKFLCQLDGRGLALLNSLSSQELSSLGKNV